MSKTELKCGCSGEEEDGEEVTMGEVVILRARKLRYLGLIIKEKGDIDGDINHHIRVGWQIWMSASRILCDKKISIGLKRKVHRVVVGLALLYSSEC